MRDYRVTIAWLSSHERTLIRHETKGSLRLQFPCPTLHHGVPQEETRQSGVRVAPSVKDAPGKDKGSWIVFGRSGVIRSLALAL
jgi:hypothetical protein